MRRERFVWNVFVVRWSSNTIEQTGQLSDDQQSQIIEIAKEFVQSYFSK